MSKKLSSTDLQVQLVMQLAHENLRKCALNNFQCSQIPHSENTDNKSTPVDVVGGVINRDGEALLPCDTCLDLPEVMRCQNVCKGA